MGTDCVGRRQGSLARRGCWHFESSTRCSDRAKWPSRRARGMRSIPGVHRPLARLMESVPGVAQVVADGATLPDFDIYCSLLSLPMAFGTDLSTIPSIMPYLRVEETRIAQWREHVPHGGRLRVGICWAGSVAHAGDRR